MNYKTLLLALIVVMFGCASNQDVVTLDDNMSVLESRFAHIEKRQKALESSLGRVTQFGATKEQDFRNKTAAMRVSFDSITETIQAIRGKLEESLAASCFI